MPRPLFVAATRQHTGKSTVSLALISGLQKRLNHVGYMKPVGQQYVDVECPSSTRPNGTVSVDKDVVLMRDFFGLRHLQWEDMSPVLIPRGYTKAYIRGAVAHEDQVRRISGAFGRVSASSDLVVCEGTGHTGVGSVVGLSNAEVASQLGADVVLVANGGIGSAFDELNLNRVMCLHHGVRVRGVVLNKVLPDKVEMVREYFTALVEGRWGVPLLGVVRHMAVTWPSRGRHMAVTYGDMVTWTWTWTWGVRLLRVVRPDPDSARSHHPATRRRHVTATRPPRDRHAPRHAPATRCPTCRSSPTRLSATSRSCCEAT